MSVTKIKTVLDQSGEGAFYMNFAAELAHKYDREDFDEARQIFEEEVRARWKSLSSVGDWTEAEGEDYLAACRECLEFEWNEAHSGGGE